MAPSDEVTLQIRGKIAIITLNIPKKLNAMNQDLYFRLASLMHEVAAMPEITITILTGNGRFFSALVTSPFVPVHILNLYLVEQM